MGQIGQIYTMIAQPWAHASRGGAVYVHAALIQRQFALGQSPRSDLGEDGAFSTRSN